MKILAEVITPGNGNTYEIMLDDKLTVGTVKEKIIEEITSFENGYISFDNDVKLFSLTLRACLPDNRNLRKAGVRGGQTMILL